MTAWTRILCAVDFSEGARQALADAADLARRHGAELTLLHVWEAPHAVATMAVVAWPVPTGAEAEELAAELERWKQEAERLAGTRVRIAFGHGAPGAAIVRMAEAGRFDVVVVGTRRHGLARALLGSVAEHVVRHAPCPVLVARPPPDWGD
ncbi:universal stress protein [Anaeromyxobacter sp. Fw109-5]|uniref:universal stress protein n=1 Tax=Anaeromyxobacter sp. (strain Fw109-5) TaxID=404589 RepID=UPI0000ED8BB3|nr:universal stress protein [Anaeromyxobacter sp. Fw109-5]ABS27289.1 UspA domain protein [Anaeromyxobacter sp. Fw109-5]